MNNIKIYPFFVILILHLFLTTDIFCQDSLTIRLKSIQNQLNDINNILKADTITTDIVGKFNLLKSGRIRNEINDSIKKFNIKSIEISIKGGTIYSIRVKSEDGRVFFKDAVGIPIINLISNEKENKKRDKIKQIDNQNNYIYITEALRYEPSIGNPFLPEDGEIILTKKDSSQNVAIGVDLNSHIDFKIYTDLLALLNNNPNGLVQSELSAKINLFDYPKSRIKHFLVYFMPYFEPSITLRKFNSSDKNISLLKEPNIKSISEQSYYDLFQRSYLDVKVDWSLLYLNDGDQNFDFRGGIGYSLSNVLLPDSSIVDGSFVYYRLGIKSQALRYKNFGVTGALNYNFLHLQKVKDFGTSRQMRIREVAGEAFYYPLGNKKNKLYARFVLNKLKRNKEIVREQPFLQIGYQTKLGFKGKN